MRNDAGGGNNSLVAPRDDAVGHYSRAVESSNGAGEARSRPVRTCNPTVASNLALIGFSNAVVGSNKRAVGPCKAPVEG
jgi:hypothetical protein